MVLKQGLRQGDPASPFLFMIVAHVLSHMLSKGADRGVFEGFMLGHERVGLSHL